MKTVTFRMLVDGQVFVPDPHFIPLELEFDVNRLVGKACRFIGCIDGLLLYENNKTVTVEIDLTPFAADELLFLQNLFHMARKALRYDEERNGLVFDVSEPGKIHATKLVH